MLLKVNKNRTVDSVGTWGTVNENDYEILNFEFPEELEEYNKRIVYYLGDERVWDAIVCNKAYITNAITKYEKVNAYVWLTKNETITLKYVCDGTEEGNYYFTYDNANYYFTMPEVEENDELIFDVATSTLKLDNITIATTSTGTGTELAFETMIDAEEDFRTQLFEMQFYENENADGIVPTEQQVDGFNTMLTAMNNKITEIDALETTIEGAEASRVTAEQGRVSAENTRVSNEATRQSNEQTRQTQEASRERRTDEAIASIQDKTAEYNANAEAKTNAFNSNATEKTNTFNSNASSKTTTFNNNASSKTSDFNTNATNETTTFNNNASSKTTDFNTNATNKTNAFNQNATDKTTAFDNNASSKTTTFNENATSKTNDFNDNATQKTTDFNNNAQAKTEAFDEHTAEMQQEIDELSANMPWNTTEQATEIQVTDAAKYSRNKLELFGNTEQTQYNGDTLTNTSNYSTTYSDLAITSYPEGIFELDGSPSASINKSSSDFVGATYSIPTGTKYVHYEYISGAVTKENNGRCLIINLTGTGNTTVNQISLYPNDYTSKKYVTKEITEESIVTKVQVMTSVGATFNHLKFRIWWSNSSNENYEPFLNQVPSPNPDYPQQIHVVTGNNRIIRDSKNMYDATKEMVTNSGITWGADNQYLYFNGTATSAGKRDFPNIQLKKGTYRIMLKVVEGSITAPDSALFYVYGSIQTSVIRLGGTSSTQNSGTFTLDEDGYIYIHGWTRTTETFNNTKIAYQVVKGDVADYNFEPYSRYIYPFELCTSKNRFDITKSRLGKTLTTSGAINDSTYSDMSDFISVKANKTYTLSFNYDELLSQNNRAVCYYNTSLKFLSGANYTIASKQGTITPTQDGYIRFAYDKNCYDIQVEEGTEATEYVSYSSLELCKIGNYQDYIYKENGNWYKQQVVYAHPFESGHANLVVTGTNFYIPLSAMEVTPVRALGYMKTYKYDSRASGFNNMANFYFGFENTGAVHLKNTNYSTGAEITKALINANEVLYYASNTPTSIQITDETLISQLEAIYNKIALAKGTNHITITPSDLAPYMKLNYMQDLPAKLDNLDSRLSLLE